MSDEPLIVCGVANGVLTLLERKNVPRDVLLKAAGLSQDDIADNDSYIPLNSFAIILEEAARLLSDDVLALTLAKELDPVAPGLTAYAVHHAPSVRHSLQTMARYIGLLVTLRTAELIEADDIGYYKWSYWKNFGGMRQYLDWVPARKMLVIKSALGEHWSPLFVKLEHSEPKNLEPYFEIFGPRLSFNQPENCFALSTRDLNKEMPRADERLWAYLVDLAETIISDKENRPEIYLSVQKEIIDHLPSNTANIETVAATLGKSPRTLQRELSDAGTSFSQILENSRMDLADKYMLDTDLNLSQIAFLLGFSELSAFTRATNRWFGESPRAHRRRLKPQIC